MKKYLGTIITAVIVITLSILSLILGDLSLSSYQLETLGILLIILGCSVLYCFIVGELSSNYSQMDKLWSIMPIVYVWVIAARGGFKERLLFIAILVTLWGIRLTFNFARKGAYSLKFWEGKEDYRWKIVQGSKFFQKRFAWTLFDFFFISLYQNALIFAICLPALAIMESNAPLMASDYIAYALGFSFLIIETIADEEQWSFYKKRGELMKDGKKLEEIDYPYSLGFNTRGLWKVMRHPNYLGEQGLWLSIYLFTLSTEVVRYGFFHWSMIGSLFLVLLFMGSSSLGEKISSSKYPKYQEYQNQVFKYLPLRKYKEK